MLRSLYVMLDYHITTTDGEIGRVEDFLFDDESWMVHYLVAETASPLGTRKVLILPFAAGRPDWETRRLPVLLTSKQIRFSPPLESDMPLSGQREPGLKGPGSHLRSVREVLGYRVLAADREVGSVEDFIIEDTLWGVQYTVIALSQPPFRSIVLSPTSVRSISLRTEAARVKLSPRELEKCPDFDPSAPVNHDEKHRLYDYYGRPVPATGIPIETGDRDNTESYRRADYTHEPVK